MAADDPLYIGPWEKDRILGTGGFGIVTLWKNRETQERVAIKKCRWGADALMTSTHKDRWGQEVRIMQRLSHPNVVRAVLLPDDLQGLTSDMPLLCMEFCSGGDLRQILNKPENCCGLREQDVRCLLSDVKEAVEYLHSQRITHRDLKPENIVLQERLNCPMIYKLIDLGYAKELDANSACSSFVGTMQYLAPEFFISDGYTSSVDYWSLGLVSYEAITGVRPFLPNATSPAEWMPKVEKKSTNDISVYEVPGSKEIKYSQQLFVENFISRCLREELEKWLRLALEWNPKKRGRSQPENKLVIFKTLDEILSKTIVTVFCVKTFSCHSYHVDGSTAVSTLQLWIERDTQQLVSEQLLLLPTGKQLTHNNLAVDCWNPNEITMLYVFSQLSLSLPDVKVVDRVPALVRWLMENPKQHLEYHHQKHVWKHAVFFLRQEYELFQLFLEAYAVKMLSLIEQSYALSQLESSVAVAVEHLVAMHKMFSETLEFDNKCYSRQLAAVVSLGDLGKLMSEWAGEVNSSAQRVANYQEALVVMKSRIQESLRRTTALQEYRDPGHNDLLAFENWMMEGYKCYDNIRKRKDRLTKYQSLDMARILYNCFKQIDISLRNPQFDEHLKLLMNCEAELVSLHKALLSLNQRVEKSKQELMRCQYIKQKGTWALMKRLANQIGKNSLSQSSTSLNMQSPTTPSSFTPPSFTPPLLLSHTSSLTQSSFTENFIVPPPLRVPSPLHHREPQVPIYPSPSISPSSSPSIPSISSPSTTSIPSNPSTTTTSSFVKVSFDLTPQQTPMSHSLTLNGTTNRTPSMNNNPCVSVNNPRSFNSLASDNETVITNHTLSTNNTSTINHTPSNNGTVFTNHTPSTNNRPTTNHSPSVNGTLFANDTLSTNNTTTTNHSPSVNIPVSTNGTPSANHTPSVNRTPSTNSTPFSLTAPLFPTLPQHIQVTSSVSLLMQPRGQLESESLIQENMEIRYELQDSMLSFTNCCDFIANTSPDWSFMETLKN